MSYSILSLREIKNFDEQLKANNEIIYMKYLLKKGIDTFTNDGYSLINGLYTKEEHDELKKIYDICCKNDDFSKFYTKGRDLILNNLLDN
jgi:hypothetical protein